MNCGLRFYSLFIFSLVVSFAAITLPCSAAMREVPAEGAPSTLDQVSYMLARDFDSKIAEPWYKPIRGFTLWHNVSKSQAFESLGYISAGVGAGFCGVSLLTLINCIKTGNFVPVERFFSLLGNGLLVGFKSWFVLGPTSVALSSALFVKILREIYRRSARGRCLMWRLELENEIRALRAITSNKFDFISGEQAESCARGLDAASPWPLPDMVVRFGQSLDLIANINRNIGELEKSGIESALEVSAACKVLKSAGTLLNQALLKNIATLQAIKPTFADQEKARGEYQKQLAERSAITQAGGTLSYDVNTAYGVRQSAVVVNNTVAPVA